MHKSIYTCVLVVKSRTFRIYSVFHVLNKVILKRSFYFVRAFYHSWIFAFEIFLSKTIFIFSFFSFYRRCAVNYYFIYLFKYDSNTSLNELLIDAT